VTAICRESTEDVSVGNRHMSEVERLQKVIKELVSTEQAYVNVSWFSTYHFTKLLQSNLCT